MAQSDVVIISGGVSVGPHDHVSLPSTRWACGGVLEGGAPARQADLVRGSPEGRPLVFGLPGNPVSAVVTFSLFVAPALAALQGAPLPAPPRPAAVLGVDVSRNPRRDQMIRVRLAEEGDTVRAYPNGAQGSHILTSLLGADALALIPTGEGTLAAGATVALHALVG
jgi:molybdopterin molybdotransferase